MSKSLAKNLSLISIFVPFDHALKFIKETLFLDLSKRLLQNSVYRIGKTLSDYFSQEFMGEERREILQSKPEIVDTAYIQVDGSFVPSIDENPAEKTSKKLKIFKENKLGVIFTSNDISKRTSKSGEENIQIKNKSFVSSIGKGVEGFKKALLKMSEIRKLGEAKTIVFISDGADWIRKLHDECFSNTERVIDWYHAMENLWSTAAKIFGEGNTKDCKLWVKPIFCMMVQNL